ncbi:MAG: zinc-dependent peptidase [Halothiobacillaceae bacterium]|jgi:Mlc titration factor MtfA (ptsG expression regulator)|nr:MAG: zinc-dependent peptidase [Halothiobacillaceae bacterium]
MPGRLRAWWRRRILERHPIGDADWSAALAGALILRRLAAPELERLRERATLFLHRTPFSPVDGFALTPAMKARIAALACLPALRLPEDALDAIRTVIVYPDAFVPEIEEMDEAGVVHRRREVRGGESWGHGAIVLAWTDVEASGHGEGYNVVIHEIAHVLDMGNGVPNGFPPLPPGMRAEAWTAAFSAAFADLNRRLDRHEEAPIDPYAAEAPEEFFAVTSELYFEQPETLHAAYPAVSDLLGRFYGGPLSAAASAP